MGTTISWHFEKHTMGSVNGLQRHNERDAKQHKNERIDPERSQDNINAVEPDMIGKTYQQRIKTRLDEFYTGKRVPRKDAIVDVQHSIQFGGDMFNELSGEKRLEVMQTATNFLIQRIGGHKNVLDLNYHRDETSDHVHMDTIPLLNDGRLSAKEMYSRQFMKETQADLLSFMQERFPELGFERADKIGRGFDNGRSQADFERLKDEQRLNMQMYQEQQKEVIGAERALEDDRRNHALDILEIAEPELKVPQKFYDVSLMRTRNLKKFVKKYGDKPEPIKNVEGRRQLFSWVKTDWLISRANQAWKAIKERLEGLTVKEKIIEQKEQNLTKSKELLADVAISLGVHESWRGTMIEKGGMVGKTTDGKIINKSFSELIPERLQKATVEQLQYTVLNMQRNQGFGRGR